MFALLKRNFTAYFLNPTGYVFLCVFTLACSCAAFLPDEFIVSNLANLDQLNRWFPAILLVFIPSVTMGIWADEKRFGTEELLLTSPLTPWQIALGKFSAALGIYIISLTFAMLAAWTVLHFLGSPDLGLFLSTCFGYALLGTGMLALGMLASFFTSQLTIAYLTGLLINTPLVALQWADAFPVSKNGAAFLQKCSAHYWFAPLGRGTVSLASILYFFAIACFALWLSTVLIQNRWSGVKSPFSFWTHTFIRGIFGILLAMVAVALATRYVLRGGCSAEKLSTFCDETLEILDQFQSDWPVTIEAYLSDEIPPELVKTRTDTLSFLSEMSDRLGKKCFLALHRVEPNTQAAYQLEKRYDIRPKTVVFDQRGETRSLPVFLTVVFRSGPKTAVIPFMHRGLSVEYELLASLLSVSNQPKKRLGILITDAALFGTTDSFGDFVMRPWPILEELARRYTIVPVDPTREINPHEIDVLLAVQPSSLTPGGMEPFLSLVRSGIPTLIFEDPWPLFLDKNLSGTTVPKRPGMPNFERPKGDIRLLWSLLGVTFGTDLVWKNYNPYPKLAALSQEFVFVDARPIDYNNGAKNDSETNAKLRPFPEKVPAVASLEHLLFPFTGYILPDRSAGTKCEPWIQSEGGGTSPINEVVSLGIQSHSRTRIDHEGIYTFMMRITGEIPRMFQRPADEKTPPKLNVLLAADLDMITGGFFTLREMGKDPERGMALDFDNITLVLNSIDTLAGDDELITIRNRRTRHRRLDRLEEATRSIRYQASASEIAIQREFKDLCRAEEEKLQEQIDQLVNRSDFAHRENPSQSPELQSALQSMQRKLNQLYDEKKEEYDRRGEETRRQLAESVRTIQGRYKLMAVAIPPLPPLIIGVAVGLRRWWNRRKDRRI